MTLCGTNLVVPQRENTRFFLTFFSINHSIEKVNTFVQYDNKSVTRHTSPLGGCRSTPLDLPFLMFRSTQKNAAAACVWVALLPVKPAEQRAPVPAPYGLPPKQSPLSLRGACS